MHLLSVPQKIFRVFNYVFLVLITILCLVPVMNLLAISMSSSAAISAGKVSLWPVEFTLEPYKYAINNPKFVTAALVSLKRVFLGVVIPILFAIILAYPLSKDKEVFKKRNVYANILLTSMLIGGGLIPGYVMLSNIKLLDTIWALVLPGAINAYAIILLQNFYRGIPKELEEAAFIDGASVWKTLWRVYIPLSKPVMATLILFQVVGHWNAWFDGLIYMNRIENYPLQTYLHTLIIQDTMLLNVSAQDMATMIKLTQRNLNSAQVFIAMIPVLLFYPFVQKYFTTGIIIGSVKG